MSSSKEFPTTRTAIRTRYGKIMLQQRLLIIPKPSWTISYLQIKKAGEFGYDDTTLIKVIKIMITDHTYIARTNGLPPKQSTNLKDLKVSIDDLSAQSRAATLLILYDSRISKRDLRTNIFT